MAQATVLKLPDPNAPYTLYCDTSDLAIDGVLTQWDEDQQADRTICFISRKLQGAEYRYPVVEQEALALCFCLKKARKYLLDLQFDLYTDSTSVKYLFHKTNPSQKLQRYIMAIQEFRFRLHHV